MTTSIPSSQFLLLQKLEKFEDQSKAGLEQQAAILKKERDDVAAMLKEQDGATPGSGTASIKSEPPPAIKEEPHENGTDLGSFDDKKVATPLLDSKDGSKCSLTPKVSLIEQRKGWVLWYH